MCDLQWHDQESLDLIRHDDADDDRREAVAEDFLANAVAEHGFADPSPDLVQKARLVFVPFVGGGVVPQIGWQIEQGRIFRIGGVERDRVVSQKGAALVGQPPTPMVRVGEFGNFQTEGHGSLPLSSYGYRTPEQNAHQ